jgi:hypothetical protein
MKFTPLFRIAIIGLVLATAAAARADVLFNNGPIITNPTGGTGAIAGQPISVAETYTIPGSSNLYSTLGISASYSDNTAAAEDFVVPASGWDLDTVTLFAFQTSQTTATVNTIRVNLWTVPPVSALSPPPLPDPLPQPVLSTPLVLAAGTGTFVCHREGHTSTGTNRPVFSYTVSLDGLPNGGVLAPGTYWLEWSFVGAATPTPRVYMPMVTPRTSAFNLNTRLWNSTDGSLSGPRAWFEGREGYVAGTAEGRPYALPMVLGGTALPEPATLALLLAGASLLIGRHRS